MKKWFLSLLAVVSVSCAQKSDLLTLFAGTYTDGFYVYSFDQASGKVVSTGPFEEAPGAYLKAGMPNPSFLCREGQMIYAVSEKSDSTASLYSWKMSGDSLVLVSSAPTGGPLGGAPCHVTTDGRFVSVANYSGGALAFYRILPDGGTSHPDTLIVSGTGGPDQRRQNKPHVHCSVFSPDGKYLFFSEFSSDEIGMADVTPMGLRSYRRAASADPDTGCRHLVFDPSGTHLYLIGELSGAVSVYDYADGKLTRKQVIKADPGEARGGADIHLSPDGKFLYASIRLKNDGIAIFKVEADGTLTDAGYQITGIHPRHFNITPNGKYLLAACRDSNEIQVYLRNPKTGLLTDTGERILLGKPVCVCW